MAIVGSTYGQSTVSRPLGGDITLSGSQQGQLAQQLVAAANAQSRGLSPMEKAVIGNVRSQTGVNNATAGLIGSQAGLVDAQRDNVKADTRINLAEAGLGGIDSWRFRNNEKRRAQNLAEVSVWEYGQKNLPENNKMQQLQMESNERIAFGGFDRDRFVVTTEQQGATARANIAEKGATERTRIGTASAERVAQINASGRNIDSLFGMLNGRGVVSRSGNPYAGATAPTASGPRGSAGYDAGPIGVMGGRASTVNSGSTMASNVASRSGAGSYVTGNYQAAAPRTGAYPVANLQPSSSRSGSNTYIGSMNPQSTIARSGRNTYADTVGQRSLPMQTRQGPSNSGQISYA